ncbi:MAG: hypothetical protein ACP5N3_00560 [Candidatus Nanoarchaeia archaeon]
MNNYLWNYVGKPALVLATGFTLTLSGCKPDNNIAKIAKDVTLHEN